MGLRLNVIRKHITPLEGVLVMLIKGNGFWILFRLKLSLGLGVRPKNASNW
jgi:hypothetical protein